MERNENSIIDITPDVKWIGILDYDIVTFDIVMRQSTGPHITATLSMPKKRHY
jgi:hypothetical protein